MHIRYGDPLDPTTSCIRTNKYDKNALNLPLLLKNEGARRIAPGLPGPKRAKNKM